MSSWVAPSIAAELWQKSLDEVLRCIRDGTIPVRREGDFTFVDIAPAFATPKSVPAPLRPPTFMVVSQDEREALMDAKPQTELNAIATEAAASADEDVVSYEAVRRATAALRRRPLAA